MKGRRFIAGAICPQCGTRDTLFIASSDEKHKQECVRCGHKNEILRHVEPQPLPTRVEPGAARDDEAVQIQVLDLPET